jgi:hypothetical protein
MLQCPNVPSYTPITSVPIKFRSPFFMNVLPSYRRAGWISDYTKRSFQKFNNINPGCTNLCTLLLCKLPYYLASYSKRAPRLNRRSSRFHIRIGYSNLQVFQSLNEDLYHKFTNARSTVWSPRITIIVTWCDSFLSSALADSSQSSLSQNMQSSNIYLQNYR